MKRSPRRSAAQWAELVAQFSRGTENERDFCTRHGLKLATLRKWRYRSGAEHKADADQSPARFVKVKHPRCPQSSECGRVMHRHGYSPGVPDIL